MSDEKKDIQMTTAICTQCGASVEVDPKQEAAVCKYCGTPFIIEKAINKYNRKLQVQVGHSHGKN